MQVAIPFLSKKGYPFGHLLQRLPLSFFTLPQHFFFFFLAMVFSVLIQLVSLFIW